MNQRTYAFLCALALLFCFPACEPPERDDDDSSSGDDDDSIAGDDDDSTGDDDDSSGEGSAADSSDGLWGEGCSCFDEGDDDGRSTWAFLLPLLALGRRRRTC